jgi:NTP pyrophosphatase (non-canonical NTP hydrolase)
VRDPKTAAEADALLRLKRDLRAFAERREWGHYHTPKNLAMALAAEVGELLALLQWLTPEEALAAASAGSPVHERLEDEIADVLIYLIRLADALAIDLETAADAKMQKNEARFPPSPT